MQFTQPNDTNMPVKAPSIAKYAFVPPSGTSGSSLVFDFSSGIASVILFTTLLSRLESAVVVLFSVWPDMISEEYYLQNLLKMPEKSYYENFCSYLIIPYMLLDMYKNDRTWREVWAFRGPPPQHPYWAPKPGPLQVFIMI
jgi:hypothetical protein